MATQKLLLLFSLAFIFSPWSTLGGPMIYSQNGQRQITNMRGRENAILNKLAKEVPPERLNEFRKFVATLPEVSLPEASDSVRGEFPRTLYEKIKAEAEKIYSPFKVGEKISITTRRGTYTGVFGGVSGGGSFASRKLLVGHHQIPTIDLPETTLARLDPDKAREKRQEYLEEKYFLPKEQKILQALEESHKERIAKIRNYLGELNSEALTQHDASNPSQQPPAAADAPPRRDGLSPEDVQALESNLLRQIDQFQRDIKSKETELENLRNAASQIRDASGVPDRVQETAAMRERQRIRSRQIEIQKEIADLKNQISRDRANLRKLQSGEPRF